MNSKISDKDKKDWKNFISSKDKIQNKDLKITKDKIKKKIIKKIDLHGFSLENANKVIEEFITQSFEEGVNKIISGDPEKSKKVFDTWKFSKDSRSSNPNWLLTDTQI